MSRALWHNAEMQDGVKHFLAAHSQLSLPIVKAIVREAIDKIQERWNARHALFVMSEVHTSRQEFDDLRHLLSFKYDGNIRLN